MDGRQLYGVQFSCTACSEPHDVPLPKPVPFLNPKLATESLEVFHSRNGRLPEGLDDFLTKSFRCPKTSEVIDLPNLDQFFFKGTGVFTAMVG
jgi:hypothetical protein